MTRYLIVDDSPTIRISVRKILDAIDPNDPQIIEAPTSLRALDEFEHAEPDIIFLDISLDGEDGDLLMNELLRRNPEAKIILITSSSREDPRVKNAISGGAFAYLLKPLRRDDVARVLAEIEHEARRTRRVH